MRSTNANVEIREIHERLGRLEAEREDLRTGNSNPDRLAFVDTEMTELRTRLRDLMNAVCPITKATEEDSV